MEVVLRNIKHCFGSTEVLNDIDFTINDGEFFTLLGPSGCGKTTILRILAGFIKPTQGQVFLGKDDITDLEPEKRHIGTVFQNYALFPHMTVGDNVRYGLKLQKQKNNVIDEKSKFYLDLVNMYDLRDRKIGELSGGQQQRVAVARSLAIEPKVLLLDEPMSNLDAVLRDKMRDEIRAIQQKLNITTLFITHDQKEALSISDKVAVLDKGKIIQQGTPIEVYSNPVNEYVANFVGDMNVIPANLFENYSGEKKGDLVYIRPEMIKIAKVKDEVDCLEGIIEKIIFEGSVISYYIRVGDVLVNSLELNVSEQSNVVGEKVFLGYKR